MTRTTVTGLLLALALCANSYAQNSAGTRQGWTDPDKYKFNFDADAYYKKQYGQFSVSESTHRYIPEQDPRFVKMNTEQLDYKAKQNKVLSNTDGSYELKQKVQAAMNTVFSGPNKFITDGEKFAAAISIEYVYANNLLDKTTEAEFTKKILTRLGLAHYGTGQDQDNGWAGILAGLIANYFPPENYQPASPPYASGFENYPAHRNKETRKYILSTLRNTISSQTSPVESRIGAARGYGYVRPDSDAVSDIVSMLAGLNQKVFYEETRRGDVINQGISDIIEVASFGSYEPGHSFDRNSENGLVGSVLLQSLAYIYTTQGNTTAKDTLLSYMRHCGMNHKYAYDGAKSLTLGTYAAIAAGYYGITEAHDYLSTLALWHARPVYAGIGVIPLEISQAAYDLIPAYKRTYTVDKIIPEGYSRVENISGKNVTILQTGTGENILSSVYGGIRSLRDALIAFVVFDLTAGAGVALIYGSEAAAASSFIAADAGYLIAARYGTLASYEFTLMVEQRLLYEAFRTTVAGKITENVLVKPLVAISNKFGGTMDKVKSLIFKNKIRYNNPSVNVSASSNVTKNLANQKINSMAAEEGLDLPASFMDDELTKGTPYNTGGPSTGTTTLIKPQTSTSMTTSTTATTTAGSANYRLLDTKTLLPNFTNSAKTMTSAQAGTAYAMPDAGIAVYSAVTQIKGDEQEEEVITEEEEGIDPLREWVHPDEVVRKSEPSSPFPPTLPGPYESPNWPEHVMSSQTPVNAYKGNTIYIGNESYEEISPGVFINVNEKSNVSPRHYRMENGRMVELLNTALLPVIYQSFGSDGKLVCTEDGNTVDWSKHKGKKVIIDSSRRNNKPNGTYLVEQAVLDLTLVDKEMSEAIQTLLKNTYDEQGRFRETAVFILKTRTKTLVSDLVTSGSYSIIKSSDIYDALYKLLSNNGLSHSDVMTIKEAHTHPGGAEHPLSWKDSNAWKEDMLFYNAREFHIYAVPVETQGDPIFYTMTSKNVTGPDAELEKLGSLDLYIKNFFHSLPAEEKVIPRLSTEQLSELTNVMSRFKSLNKELAYYFLRFYKPDKALEDVIAFLNVPRLIAAAKMMLDINSTKYSVSEKENTITISTEGDSPLNRLARQFYEQTGGILVLDPLKSIARHIDNNITDRKPLVTHHEDNIIYLSPLVFLAINGAPFIGK